MVSNSTAEIDTKVAEEIQRLNEEYEKGIDGNYGILLETKYLSRLSQLDLKMSQYIDFLGFRHHGEQPLKIDLSIHDLLPSIDSFAFQGKFEFTKEAYDGVDLKYITLIGDDIVRYGGSTILEMLHNSTRLYTIIFTDLSDFSFLQKQNEISFSKLILENVEDTSDPDLVAFIEHNSMDKILIYDNATYPLHPVYTKKEGINVLRLENTGLTRIPQAIINRINRFRLSGDNEDEISILLDESNLQPRCVNYSFEFTNKNIWHREYAKSKERFHHYITEHYETGNFEELPSCQKFLNQNE